MIGFDFSDDGEEEDFVIYDDDGSLTEMSLEILSNMEKKGFFL